MATDLNANFVIYLLRSIWLHFMFTLLVIHWKVQRFRVNIKTYIFRGNSTFYLSLKISLFFTGFPKDRKELILQYLSGLASRSCSSDQMVVKEFLTCLGSSFDVNDALDYLKSVQKMKGEWYNQQGKYWSLL